MRTKKKSKRVEKAIPVGVSEGVYIAMHIWLSNMTFKTLEIKF